MSGADRLLKANPIVTIPELTYSDLVMRFDYVWLRDHCRSASCFNSKTNQRSLDTAQVDLAIKPANIRSDNDAIYITCELFFQSTL